MNSCMKRKKRKIQMLQFKRKAFSFLIAWVTYINGANLRCSGEVSGWRICRLLAVPLWIVERQAICDAEIRRAKRSQCEPRTHSLVFRPPARKVTASSLAYWSFVRKMPLDEGTMV